MFAPTVSVVGALAPTSVGQDVFQALLPICTQVFWYRKIAQYMQVMLLLSLV